jgi:hypothetical protein
VALGEPAGEQAAGLGEVALPHLDAQPALVPPPVALEGPQSGERPVGLEPPGGHPVGPVADRGGDDGPGHDVHDHGPAERQVEQRERHDAAHLDR